MKSEIRALAQQLGFDVCRFTSASPPESGGQFREWLDRGDHGTLGYMERNAEKRLNPQLVLPGAKSVITLATSYASPANAESTPPHPNTGVVARYAHATDYHDWLAPPLKQLARFVDETAGPGTRSLWYVDTGPILERDLAQRAGIGFVSKHTNLISRELGNWFFLSEIITTAELETDPPEMNRCGTCTRCISACPTAAIRSPFQLDARRCISYLTIELKGSIPIELRPLIGDRLFGCDDCLAACPWNRFAREGSLMKEHVSTSLSQPDLLELLSLDEAGFKQRFAGTPFERTRRRGVLRNACVVLGNVGGADALPALERAAHDPEPLIAEHALWAIDQIRAR